MELNTGNSQPWEADKQNNEKACLIFNVRHGASIADVTHGKACSIGKKRIFYFPCGVPVADVRGMLCAVFHKSGRFYIFICLV